jgi:hypothetical protein
MIQGATFQKVCSINQLNEAIATTARHVGAEYDEPVLMRALDVFREPFEAGCSAYRTTTRENRRINTRYFNLTVPHNPFVMAVENGLLEANGHPGMEIIPYTVDNLMTGETAGWGVDIGSSYGLEKIWTFLGNSVPLQEILRIPGLPDGIEANLDYFEKHHLDPVHVVGVDFRAKSVNVYYVAWEIGGLTPERVAHLLSDLGFDVPDEEMLSHCAQAIPVYYTFNWESPDIQRVCFAGFAPDPSLVPRWHPVMETFVAEAQTIANERMFYYNPTFVRDGDGYSKIEICFHEAFAGEVLKIMPKSFRDGLPGPN